MRQRRFAREAEPAMQRYAASEPTVLLAGIKAAKQALVASDKDEAQNFLMADLCGFSKARATAILESFEREEGGRPPETAWDMAMAITAKARTIHHQDARLDMEAIGARVMKKAAQAV